MPENEKSGKLNPAPSTIARNINAHEMPLQEQSPGFASNTSIFSVVAQYPGE